MVGGGHQLPGPQDKAALQVPTCSSAEGNQPSGVQDWIAPRPGSTRRHSQNPAAGSLQVALRGFSFQEDLNIGCRVSDTKNTMKHKNRIV